VLYDGEVCLGGGVISAAARPPVVPAVPVRRMGRSRRPTTPAA